MGNVHICTKSRDVHIYSLCVVYVCPQLYLTLFADYLEIWSLTSFARIFKTMKFRSSMSKYYNCTKFCYLCNSNKSHTNQKVIIQQPLITTICINCINRCHQSRTGRLTKNTAYVLCNRSISHPNFEGHVMGLMHKGSSTNSGHYTSMV